MAAASNTVAGEPSQPPSYNAPLPGPPPAGSEGAGAAAWAGGPANAGIVLALVGAAASVLFAGEALVLGAVGGVAHLLRRLEEVVLAIGLVAVYRRRDRRRLAEFEGSVGLHEEAPAAHPPAMPLAAGAPPRQRWWGLPQAGGLPRGQQQEEMIVVVQPDRGVALCVKEEGGEEAGGSGERERQSGSRHAAEGHASQGVAGVGREHAPAAAQPAWGPARAAGYGPRSARRVGLLTPLSVADARHP